MDCAKKTNAVAFYEEHAFHDNPEDIGWWHEHMTEVAESAAKGLCEWFGIPYVEKTKPAEPEQPEDPVVTETYTVKVTRSADGKSGTWEIVK